mgnify:CR=1 FL=1
MTGQVLFSWTSSSGAPRFSRQFLPSGAADLEAVEAGGRVFGNVNNGATYPPIGHVKSKATIDVYFAELVP